MTNLSLRLHSHQIQHSFSTTAIELSFAAAVFRCDRHHHANANFSAEKSREQQADRLRGGLWVVILTVRGTIR